MSGMTKEELMKHVYLRCAECDGYITDQIIRLEGKPYHSKCFFCHGCHLELSGKSFVPPTAERPDIYCVDCHQERFAHRCVKCSQPILPAQGEDESKILVFMQKDYHAGCFKCEDCGCDLRTPGGEGKGCFPFQGALLCRPCNQARVEECTRP